MAIALVADLVAGAPALGSHVRDPFLPLLANAAIWSAIGIIAGAVLFYRGFRLLQRKRLILDIPQCTIRGASLGLVEVNGTTSGPYTLLSPLSEEDCYFYRAQVWQASTSGSSGWRKLAEEVLCVPFFLDDGTGQMLIDPRGAEFDLLQDFDETTTSAPWSAEFPESMRHFLARHGVTTVGPLRFEEYCVKPASKLFVLGTVRESPGMEAIAEASASAFRRVGQEYLSEAAADLQRRSTLSIDLPPVEKTPSPSNTAKFDRDPPVVLMKGERNEPFLLSWRSQHDVVRELARKSVLYIWGGPVLVLVGLWLLMDRLGVL